MDKMSDEDRKFIQKLTSSEVLEILNEAAFHNLSTEEWLQSSWSSDIRRRVMKRENKLSEPHN